MVTVVQAEMVPAVKAAMETTHNKEFAQFFCA